MANKNDFTPEEWTKVLESIIAAGIAVSAIDPSGWWGTLKEAAAGTPALAAAKRDPNSNELIKAAVAAFEKSNDGSILARNPWTKPSVAGFTSSHLRSPSRQPSATSQAALAAQRLANMLNEAFRGSVHAE
jgi:hypothetical protein